MKTPKTLMQEIEAHHTIDILLYNEIERRSTPFKPEMLLEFGFVKGDSHETRNIYTNGNIIIFVEILIVRIRDGLGDFTFPLWKTIDEFESDLSRVLGAIK